ncbi:MAG: acyl carrier protein [Bacteroidetes bacterium]|nr:acyl carrier protein [Bacteroidota bacterium]
MLHLPNYPAMTLEDFIKNIEAEFEDIVPGKLTPETNFREVFDWNSINALILIAMVKTEYGAAINAEDIQKSKTINDLYETVKSKL